MIAVSPSPRPEAPLPRAEAESPARYAVRAVATAQTLSRLVNYFAQQDLVPSAMTLDADGEWFDITIELAGLDDHRARIIAEKMSSTPLVEHVALTRDGTSLLSLSGSH